MKKKLPANSDGDISYRAQMYKALGDETRLRILGLLRRGELCVCDIMEVLKLPQSTASRHLAYLKNSGWVTGGRRGKWMYYRLRPAEQTEPVQVEIIADSGKLPQCEADFLELQHYLQEKKSQQCS